MHADHAVFDLAAAAQPLPRDGDGVRAALGRPRLVHATDGLGGRVLPRDQALAIIPQLRLVPLDGFQKAL